MVKGKKQKKPTTVGERLKERDAQGKRQALKIVDEWFKSCIRQLESPSTRKGQTIEVVVHSVEVSGYPGNFDAYKLEFNEAARVLLRRLKGQELEASYAFSHMDAKVLEGGMFPGGGREDRREYPAEFRLVFKVQR
jgi:hypothetical protein